MRIATWNIGEDERNIDGKLEVGVEVPGAG